MSELPMGIPGFSPERGDGVALASLGQRLNGMSAATNDAIASLVARVAAAELAAQQGARAYAVSEAVLRQLGEGNAGVSAMVGLIRELSAGLSDLREQLSETERMANGALKIALLTKEDVADLRRLVRPPTSAQTPPKPTARKMAAKSAPADSPGAFFAKARAQIDSIEGG